MRTLLMLPLLLLPFTAQAASLLPGGDYPAPDCRSPLRPLPGDLCFGALYRNQRRPWLGGLVVTDP